MIRLSATAFTTTLAITTAAVLLIGCVSSPPIVADAEGQAFVDAVSMTCSQPYDLPQDCAGISGPAKKIEIGGVPMKIAGSADGKLIVVNGGSWLDRRGEGNNEAYQLVKTLLEEHGVTVIRATPLVSAKILKGYAVFTDAPAYDLLNDYQR